MERGKGTPGRAYSLHRLMGDTRRPGRLEWRTQGVGGMGEESGKGVGWGKGSARY